MNDFFECSLMQSSFKEDKLIVPHKGFFKMTFNEQLKCIELILKHHLEKVYFYQNDDELFVSCHKVCLKSDTD